MTAVVGVGGGATGKWSDDRLAGRIPVETVEAQVRVEQARDAVP